MGLFDIFSENKRNGSIFDSQAFIDKYKFIRKYNNNYNDVSYQLKKETLDLITEMTKFLVNSRNIIPCKVDDIVRINNDYTLRGEPDKDKAVRHHILYEIYHGRYFKDLKSNPKLASQILIKMAETSNSLDRFFWLQEARSIYPDKGWASIAMVKLYPESHDNYYRNAIIDNLVSLTTKSLPSEEAFQWALTHLMDIKSTPYREEILLEIFRIVITKSSYKSSDFQNVSLTTNEKMEFFMEILDHINDGHLKKTSKIISAIERVIYEFNLLQANSYNLYFDNYIPDIIGRFDHNDYNDSYVKTFITYARSKTLI